MNKKELSEYIGDVIKRKREELGLRQEHLAEFLGFSRASIINLEKGRHSIQVNSLFDLSLLFKCKIDEFFPPAESVDFVIEKETVFVEKTKRVFKVLTNPQQSK
jgi:transcriptional regulator with XRE-family HTH domain